jgi:uncharacterized protein (TIGR01777 family)
VRFVLLGGSGLVGRALAEDWAQDGHAVVVVCRHPENVVGLRSGIDLVKWDARTALGWGHLVDGADAVVNLAGETLGGTNFGQVFFQRWTESKKREILQSRLYAGKALVEAVRSARVKPARLVQMSAVGFYGPHDDEELDENSPPGTGFLAGVCAEWEGASRGVEAFGVKRIVVRTGLVLTLQGGFFPYLILPFRLFVGGPLGSGRQGLPWIHAEDHRRGLRFVSENPGAGGTYNLTAPQPISNAEAGRAIAKASRRPYWFPTPAFLLRLVLGEKATLALDGQRVLPRRLLEAGFTFRYPTIDDALADLTR